MKLSKSYDKIFEKTFTDYVDTVKESKLKDTQYCLFYPMIGKDYFDKKEILVIGIAVNNWGNDGWSSNDKNENIIQKASDYSIAKNKQQCPISCAVNDDWTDKNSRVRYSKFWQLTYKLIQRCYERNDINWSYIMAWSNLYKIAPHLGGNPNKKLEWDSQLKNCKELFRKEIEELKPKNILMMTGLSWANDFIEDYKIVKNDIVAAIAKVNDSNIIITTRPENKNQEFFIKNTLAYFK